MPSGRQSANSDVKWQHAGIHAVLRRQKIRIELGISAAIAHSQDGIPIWGVTARFASNYASSQLSLHGQMATQSGEGLSFEMANEGTSSAHGNWRNLMTQGHDTAACTDLDEFHGHPTASCQRLHRHLRHNMAAKLVQVNVVRWRENEGLLALEANVHLSCFVFAAAPPGIVVRESVVDIVAGHVDMAALHRVAAIRISTPMHREFTTSEIGARRVLVRGNDLQAPNVPCPGGGAAHHQPQTVRPLPDRLQR